MLGIFLVAGVLGEAIKRRCLGPDNCAQFSTLDRQSCQTKSFFTVEKLPGPTWYGSCKVDEHEEHANTYNWDGIGDRYGRHRVW